MKSAHSGCPSLHGLTTGTQPQPSGATLPAIHPANPVMASTPFISTGTRNGASPSQALRSLSLRSATPMADRTSASRAPSESMVNSRPRTRALLRSVVLRVDFIERTCLSKLIIPHWPVSPGAATLPAAQAPADITTVSPQMQPTNIRKDPAMNTIHPLERWVLNRPAIRKHILNVFLEDNHISESERMVLDLLGESDREIAEYRQREVAADSLKRNGLSRVTRERFEDAGLKVIDLAAERSKRPAANVVELRPRQHAG